MDRKAQATIVGSVLISGIVMALVGVTIFWGKPLIDKTTDKTHITNVINKMQEIDSIIKYVADTNSSQSVSIDLKTDDDFSIANNELVYKTVTQVPVIASVEWVPLNVYEMPFQKQVFDVIGEQGSTVRTDAQGIDTAVPYWGTIKVSEKNVNVIIYKKLNLEAYTVCLTNSLADTGVEMICADEGRTLRFENKDFEIKSARQDEAIFLGPESENIGILGKDSPGIIIGKTSPGQNENMVTIKLVYRGLMDNLEVKHEYIIQCSAGCAAKKGSHKLRISFDKVERRADVTRIYINTEFE